MRSLALFALAACSSPAPVPAKPVSTPEVPADAAPEPDAAAEAKPDIRLTAPVYIFRFTSKARAETWTLWFVGGVGILNVDTAGGVVTQYQGSAKEGETIEIDVASATAKMKLSCKPVRREIDGTCDPKAKKKPKKIQVDALDCYHADFKEPMPFALKPGIEYIADGTCAGYRLIDPL